MTPLDIILVSMFIPIPSSKTNLAKGEIVKLNFRDAGKEPIGKQVVGTTDGFDWIWRHLGRNYWKVVGKYKESPWSCQ